MTRIKKYLSVLLALAMLCCLVPSVNVAAADVSPVETLKFATMSDIHIYPQSLTGGCCPAWLANCRNDCKEYEESEAIVDTALATLKARVEREGIEYLLIPGDLTRYSEKVGHEVLAAKLRRFEQDTGVPVFVIDGNHDINTYKAASFENGVKEAAEPITAQGFYETYADLGYDLADSFYAIENGVVQPVQNALSYTAQLSDKVQLIVVDSCIYSFDEPAKDTTNGVISDECMEWIIERADAAAAQGKENILMIHHSMAAHMQCEPSVTFAFVLDNYVERSEELADHNVHYALTGHLHIPDTAQIVNDNGQVLTDVQTCALTAYPNQYRENTFTVYSDGSSDIATDEVDFDAEAPYVYGDTTYAQGGFALESFGKCFGGPLDNNNGVASLTGFVHGLYNGYAVPLFDQIVEGGGLLGFLKEKGIDLEALIGGFLEPYIGTGVKVAGKTVLSVDNIMWFLEDLSAQIDALLGDPDALWDALEPAIRKLAGIRLSDLPVDQTIQDAIGVGRGKDYSTLEEVVFSAVYYWTTGNEKPFGEDAMIADVIEKLNEPVTEDSGMHVFGALLDIVYNDVVNGVILSNLHVRLDTLFGNTLIGTAFGRQINNFVKQFLHGDTSYLNLVNTFFSLGALDYTSLYDVLDKLLLQEYWTPSQDESLNATLAWFIKDFTTDEAPELYGDYGVSYSDAGQEPEATAANYRKPTMVSVTLGDTPAQANINWFAKYSLPETDIEIYDLDDGGNKVAFTGSYSTASADVTRYFPGIDLGIIGFIKYQFAMTQHTVRLDGLTPGGKYAYRVGNADRGWWSDWATLEAPDGGNEVTFIHTSDPQSQNEAQYTRAWANVLKKAFELYPEAKFIANSGDMVDYGMNNHQWQWMFDTAAGSLMNTYLMPATGNHEGKDDYSTVSNFILPNVPEQDTASGVYYSYDYNNLHVAVLNTNDLTDDDALSDKQVNWLKSDMKASAARWKIVVLHKALYSNGSHYDDDDVTAMRAQLGALMPDLDIDLVLQGHDHVYLRTASLDNNKKVKEEITYLRYGDDGALYKTFVQPDGTLYAINGCAGVKLYKTKDETATDEAFPRADKIVDADAPMFCAVQIKDGVMYVDAYLVDGDTVVKADSYAIQKDTAQGEVAPKSEWPAENSAVQFSMKAFEKFVGIIKKIFTVMNNFMKIFVFGDVNANFETVKDKVC